MTKTEIIRAIETDPYAIIEFTAENNPSDLIVSVNVAGYKTVTTVDGAKEVLKALIAQNKQSEFITILKGVPYINDAPNQTAGMKEYFFSKLSASEQQAYLSQQSYASRTEGETDMKSSLLNIGTGVIGIVGSIFGTKQAYANATMSDAVARAEMAKTTKIVVIIVGSLLLVLAVIFAFKKSK